ncbi:Gx transporter family protein [Lactobacillus corticis]|uniref:Gx transporter family protein n=1 Tax=Lactobacillus corticis TaxID=2201249 RepID=UPI001FE6D806|nr:Gx transporter family protein [Lactobacillus corticis]
MQRNVWIGILCSQGIILGVVEQMFPALIAVLPGAKIGLTNVITLMALFTLPFSDCILLTFLRLILTSLITGGAATFIYSFAGAFLSLFMMKLASKMSPRVFSILGVSMIGGITHNFGQILVAYWISGAKSVLLYLPFLALSGLLAGLLVGLGGKVLLSHLNDSEFIKDHQISFER